MPIAYLLGVVENGSARGPLVPISNKRTLRAVMGAGLLIRVAVVNPGGDPVDIELSRFVLTIRRRSWDLDNESEYRNEVTIGADPELDIGRVDFLIPGTRTRQFVPGWYVYDIWWIGPLGDAQCIVGTSGFVVEPTVGVFDDTDIAEASYVTANQVMVCAMTVPVIAGGQRP